MSFQTLSFQEVLDDLQSRFIINVPEEELSSVERICFQIEQAHWFYEDFVREENPRLSSFSLKNFCAQFFQYCPLLHRWAHDHETAFQNFMEYKVRVPVCGAIILNGKMDKVLLVKGWKASSGWGFPKGKINKDEPEAPCAIREVQEETGFDISPYLRENEYVERTIKGQRIRLYILTGVPEDTIFIPQTRKEIGDIQWHRLDDLPGWNKNVVIASGEKRHKFYMVTAFVSGLRQWMGKYRKAKRQGKARNGRHLSVVLGYNTGTDSEGEGGYSDAGFRSGTEPPAERMLRIPSVMESARAEIVEVEEEAEPPTDSRAIDPYAAAQSIKALIGIGGTANAPAVGVRVDVQARSEQPLPQVAIGVSFDNGPVMQQQPVSQMYNQPYPALPAPLPQHAPHVQPQHYDGRGSPALEVNRGPSVPSQEALKQYYQQQPAPVREAPQYPPQYPPQFPPRYPPHPGQLRQQTGPDRQAHKKSLLDILTKGTSDENLAGLGTPGSDGGITARMGSHLTHILPNPPQHPSFRPNPSYPVPSVNSPYSEAPPPSVRRASNSSIAPPPEAPLAPGSGRRGSTKQQMFMDILRGGPNQGADSAPTQHPQYASHAVDENAAEDQLKSILGIGGLHLGASKQPPGHMGNLAPMHQYHGPAHQEQQHHRQQQHHMQSAPPPSVQESAYPPRQPQQQAAHDLKALLGLGRTPPPAPPPSSVTHHPHAPPHHPDHDPQAAARASYSPQPSANPLQQHDQYHQHHPAPPPQPQRQSSWNDGYRQRDQNDQLYPPPPDITRSQSDISMLPPANFTGPEPWARRSAGALPVDYAHDQPTPPASTPAAAVTRSQSDVAMLPSAPFSRPNTWASQQSSRR